MEGFVELGGFRMAPQLTVVSLYVIACMPFHGHVVLTSMDFSGDTSRATKGKVYQTIAQNVHDLRQRLLLLQSGCKTIVQAV